MNRVAVLTYHAMNISGDSHASNDHVALAEDLDRLSRDNIRVRPLSDVIDALLGDRLDRIAGSVAITFDDGSDFDFLDLPHPTWGPQRGMAGIIGDTIDATGHDTIEATSFVVVSPDARVALDRTCMIGAGWWNDDWWQVAEAGGRLRVESHSWDHNHSALMQRVSAAEAGTFDIVDSADADREIRDANAYLCARRGRSEPVLFAYPYGEANEFLSREYFPRGRFAHGVRAAFTTAGRPVERTTDRWLVPRYVCGWHWKSSDDLRRLLDDAFASADRR